MLRTRWQQRCWRFAPWRGAPPAAIVWLPDGEQQLDFSCSQSGYSGTAEGLTRRLCLRKKELLRHGLS